MLPLIVLLLASASAAGAPCRPAAGLEAWAGSTAASSGMIKPGERVSLALTASPAPGQPAARAGSARLMIATAGTYRIAIDQHGWIDLLADGKALASIAHQHGPDCGGIVKIVDFRLATGTYRLAISRTAASVVNVLVVRGSDR